MPYIYILRNYQFTNCNYLSLAEKFEDSFGCNKKSASKIIFKTSFSNK